jgi:arabinogalactan oligomer/maltooligosaccharide transport system permease protein
LKPFFRWLFNSSIVSFMVTVVGVSLASTAGYAFSRFKFAGRDAGMIALIATQMFPVTMLLLPLFLMLIKLKVYDTFLGLVIAYAATALPFCIWQMKGYYDTIPYSLEEAARLTAAAALKPLSNRAAAGRAGVGDYGALQFHVGVERILGGGGYSH